MGDRGIVLQRNCARIRGLDAVLLAEQIHRQRLLDLAMRAIAHGDNRREAHQMGAKAYVTEEIFGVRGRTGNFLGPIISKTIAETRIMCGWRADLSAPQWDDIPPNVRSHSQKQN